MTKKIDIFRKKKVWTKTPRAFIFLVCQLIHEKYGSFCHEDLLDFLGTKTEEVTYFLKNPEIIPIEWLIRLGETPEGNDLLAKFNSLPKRTIRDQEYCLISGESDYQNEDDVVRRLLAEGDLYDLPENDLLAVFLDEAIEESPDSRIIPLTKRDEKIVSTPAVSLDKKDKKPSDLGDNKNKGEEKIVVSEAKKVVIGKKKRTCTRRKKIIIVDHSEQFLAGLYRICSLRDMSGLNRVFGAERVAQFKKDGTVSHKWVEILMGYNGGKAHLERFRGILKIASEKGEKKELKPVSIIGKPKTSQEVIQPVLIPVKEASVKAEPEIQMAQEKSVPEVEVISKKNHRTMEIDRALEAKPDVITKVENPLQEVLTAKVNGGETAKPSSESVTKEISSLEVKKASQISSIKETNEKKKSADGKSGLGFNGFKIIPRLEVLSVLMCMQEIITGKRVTQASDLDVDCIAKELEVPPKDISTMRKGGIPMHMGHLQVVKKKYGSKSDLLGKWE